MFWWYLAPWIGLCIGYLIGATIATGIAASKLQRYHDLVRNRDCVLEHDKRCELVYIKGGLSD